MRSFALQPRTLLLGSFVSTSIIQTVFGIAMGWLLTPGDFGLLAFVHTALLIAVLVLNAGFPAALTTALLLADASRRARLIRGAAVANVALGLGMSAVLLLLFALGPFRPGFETPLVAGSVALAFPLLALTAIARAAAQGLERFGMIALLQVIEVGVKAIAGLGLIQGGFDVTGAVLGNLAGAIAAAALGLWLLAGLLRIRLLGPIERPSLKDAGELFGALIGLTLLLSVDQVMLKLVSGADRGLIGQYQAAAVLANSPYFLACAVLPVLFTRAAQLRALDRTSALMKEALQLGLLTIVPHALIIAAAPDILLSLCFPKATVDGIRLVPILALANCAVTFVAILAVPFNATGNAKIMARILGRVLVAEIAVLWVVVPIWHTIGAAITFVGATAVTLAALGCAYCAEVGARPTRRSVVWCLKYGAVLVACVLAHILTSAGRGYGTLVVAGVDIASYVVCLIAMRLVVLPRLAPIAGPDVLVLGSLAEASEAAEAIAPELVSPAS